MTVPASIRELEKIEMVRRSNGGYRLDHAISKRQRTILSAFGMDDEDIKTLASNINTMLSNNQSLLTETMEAETTEEEKPLARTRSISAIDSEIQKIEAELIKDHVNHQENLAEFEPCFNCQKTKTGN